MMKEFILSLSSCLILLSFGSERRISAFTIQNSVPALYTASTCTTNHQKQQLFRGPNRSGIFFPHNMVSDEIVSASKKNIVDGNDVEFTEGCIVQTCVEIKAYQVPKKAYGSFDEDSKSFVPLEGIDDGTPLPRRDMCLVLPKGIRANVARVYDIDEFDASSPILVKFQVGEGLGGEYAPPVTFLMHFRQNEVEVIQ
mmetsp:Transcript_14799/g.22419  ORF Transcript_14799/g.22419 Transcript_14799/m.22419 type:complete len:197 (-) Transcript_14799:149-739(-)